MSNALKEEKLILWFNEILNKDIALVGGKAASLGEMISKLQDAGVKVPNGFAITVNGYKLFLDQSPGLQEYINKELHEIRPLFLDLQKYKKLIKFQKESEEIRKQLNACAYYETSAKKGTGVQEFFLKLVSNIYRKS